MSDALLHIEGVYKAYDQHLVLRNINLAVERHEVISLIGASGCGKSTLLRCVNLLEDVNAGVIRLNVRIRSADNTPMTIKTILRRPPNSRSLATPQPTRPTMAPAWVRAKAWLAQYGEKPIASFKYSGV